MLKVQFNKANKEYEGTQILTFRILIRIQMFMAIDVTFTIMFIDLPASTPLVDLSKIADLNIKKLPKVEEAGDRYIR